MTITYLGSLSVGAAVPGAAAAISAGLAGIGGALANLQAQLTALNAFVPTAIDLKAQLELAKSVVVSVQAAITLGIVPPDPSAQLAMVAAQIAGLTAMINGILMQRSILLELQAPLEAAGVHGYAFDGATQELGNELDGALNAGVPGGAGGDHANAVVLVTTIPATWIALGQILKVAP